MIKPVVTTTRRNVIVRKGNVAIVFGPAEARSLMGSLGNAIRKFKK